MSDVENLLQFGHCVGMEAYCRFMNSRLPVPRPIRCSTIFPTTS